MRPLRCCCCCCLDKLFHSMGSAFGQGSFDLLYCRGKSGQELFAEWRQK